MSKRRVGIGMLKGMVLIGMACIGVVICGIIEEVYK